MGCASSSQTAPAVTDKVKAAGEIKTGRDDQRRESVLIEQRQQLDFARVMDDPTGIEHLLKFAKKEFNEEQLLFWIDIMRLKRDLADTSIWDGSAPEAHPASSPPAAPAPKPPPPPDDDPFGEPPDPFGEPPSSGDIFSGDNIFDADSATHGAGGASSGSLLSSSAPPPEAASGDREGFLKRRAMEIVDKYLCNGAEYQVTMPDHKYKLPCAKASPAYEFSLVFPPSSEGGSSLTFDAFDTFSELAYKQVKNETFMRFRLSDAAETLASLRPQLLADTNDVHQKQIEITLGRPPSVFDVQRELRTQLVGLADKVGCERVTVWVVNQLEGKLWNVASTQLGNSVISIRMHHGLAGKAATTGADVVSNDPKSDAVRICHHNRPNPL